MSTNRETHYQHYPESAPEFTEHVVWSRVAAVALTGIALLVILVWGSMKIFGGSNSQPFDPSVLPATAALPKTSSTSEEPLATPETATVVQPISGVIERETITQSAQKDTTETTQTLSMLSETPATPATKQAEESTQQMAKHQPSVRDEETNSVSAEMFSVQTQVVDGDVSRAALSDQMDGLEPATEIDSSAALTADFLKLYFFTDISGRRGDTLTYIWSQDGKTIAKVRIPVTSNRWRSHSSKNFNKKMRGDWKVVVKDKAGKTLATSKFTLPKAES